MLDCNRRIVNVSVVTELDSPTHGPMDEPLRFQDIKTRSAADVSQLRQLLNG